MKWGCCSNPNAPTFIYEITFLIQFQIEFFSWALTPKLIPNNANIRICFFITIIFFKILIDWSNVKNLND